MGTKHHYVPRFYLQRFACDPDAKRINVFNLSRRELFSAGSLKDQCYRDRFYGPDHIETGISKSERRWGVVLSEIVGSQRLPKASSANHDQLLFFIAVQMLRTAKAADEYVKVGELMAKVASRGNQDIEKRLLNQTKPLPAVFGPLSGAGRAMHMMDDLAARLIRSPEPAFLTSDHPAIRYNAYMEGLKDVGTTGLVQRGLLIFVPISVYLTLMLFDSYVYTVPNHRSRLLEGTASDVRQLNLLQAVFAPSNLFVPNGFDRGACCSLVDEVQAERSAMGPQVREFAEDGNPNRSLLVTFSVMPSIALNLSFLKISRQAGRVPLWDRMNLWRRSREELDQFASPYDAPVPFGKSTRFSRRLQ